MQDAADLVAYLNKPWDGVGAFTGSNWEACVRRTGMRRRMASSCFIWGTSHGRLRNTITGRH